VYCYRCTVITTEHESILLMQAPYPKRPRARSASACTDQPRHTSCALVVAALTGRTALPWMRPCALHVWVYTPQALVARSYSPKPTRRCAARASAPHSTDRRRRRETCAARLALGLTVALDEVDARRHKAAQVADHAADRTSRSAMVGRLCCGHTLRRVHSQSVNERKTSDESSAAAQ
jgi:hypothetical protein